MSALLLSLLVSCLPTAPPRPFAIEVVDAQTGRGVPLIELRTVNEIRLYTDSNGLVAFDEPGLMGETVYFHVSGHGYEHAKDGFGYRGKALRVEPGGHARLEVTRINVAERLYRVTGAGIYADTIRLERSAPIENPVINGLVLGQDSVINGVFRGQLYWFWGDTNRPGYPLGNFHVPGATSRLPRDGGLDPETGVNLEYFVDARGFAKETCRMPGDGPTWLGGLCVIHDPNGRERMFAGYVKVKPPLTVYEHGLAEFDADEKRWKKVAVFAEGSPIYPTGQTFLHEDRGKTYVYFCTPYAWTRVQADPEALTQLERYEGLTCLREGTRPEQGQLDRDPEGRLHYSWRPNTPPLSLEDQKSLIKSGMLRPGEGLIALRDVVTGKEVRAHGGSINWNAHRKRWILIAVESFGSASMLGEVWYAESDAPTGPWVYARKIVTHDKYSFYNPKQHPYFDKKDGRIIFFEGTYTHTFSGNPGLATPRYDYNQVMYKLDLEDDRLNLPVAIKTDPKAERAGFYALRTPHARMVPVYEIGKGSESRLSLERPNDQAQASFYGDPVEGKGRPGTSALFEFVSNDGARRVYGTEDAIEGYRRKEPALCRVWTAPVTVVIPDH